METTKFGITRRRFYFLALLAMVITGLVVLPKAGSTGAAANTSPAQEGKSVSVAPAATFIGFNTGPIPDPAAGNCWGAFVPTPRNVTFDVSGVSGPPTNVELSTTFSPNHTWGGDVRATLIAPNGASHIVFSRTGATTATAAGDSSDLAGPYNFKDSAAGTNWWTAAANETSGTAPVPAGDYRTTTGGGVAGAGTNTSMTPAFSTVVNTTGTWTLRLEDGCSSDAGSISAATLTITSVAPTQHVVDYDGDGRTDYSIARNGTPPGLSGHGDEFFRAESIREKLRIQSESPEMSDLVPPPVGSNLQWWNRGSVAGAVSVFSFGEPLSDFIVPNDYDGDGKTDIAVWRPGTATNAAFYTLQSSNNVVVVTPFGQTNDDPAITGDYDGDGKADYASFRCPPIGSPGQCFFYYKGSLNNPGGNITYVPWGFGQQFDFFVNPGDFDGDGKFDFCIQRTRPGASPGGQFVLLKSNGFGVEYINWGLNTDIIVPGDYDGDGKADFMVSRTETYGGNPGRSYYLLTRTGGGTGYSPIRWGIAGDIRAPGDYDGDGKTDVAIWRPNANPSQNFFYVLRSSDGALQTFEWGQQGDAAVASWNVH